MHRVGVGPCLGTTSVGRHFEGRRGEGGSLTTALLAPSPPSRGGERACPPEAGKGEGADASLDGAEPMPHARIAQHRAFNDRS